MNVLENKPTSLFGFYTKQSTTVLKAVLVGFERDFDARSAGQNEYPNTAWLSERIRAISMILEDRRADAYNNSREGKAAYQRFKRTAGLRSIND